MDDLTTAPLPAPARPPSRPTVRGALVDRVDVGDAQLAVTRAGGDGPMIVLLHGIPGDRRTFDGVVDRLAPSARLVAPDLLGFGDSDRAPPGTHAAGQAARLARLVDELGYGPVHLVGFDFGGPTAVHLAAARRDRIASLTLVATNLFADTPVPGPLGLARFRGAGELLFAGMFSRPGLAAMWRGATGDRAAFPYRRFARLHDHPHGIASAREVFLASLRDLPGLYGPVETAAAALRLPALVVWGDRDPFFPLEVAHRTAAQVGGELRIAAGCGHFVPEERPELLADAVLAHVRRAA